MFHFIFYCLYYKVYEELRLSVRSALYPELRMLNKLDVPQTREEEEYSQNTKLRIAFTKLYAKLIKGYESCKNYFFFLFLFYYYFIYYFLFFISLLFFFFLFLLFLFFFSFVYGLFNWGTNHSFQ